MRARPAAVLLTLLLLGLGPSGCTAPAPWQRGTLARPEMALEPNPSQRLLREHTYTSREAAAGGHSAGGGGCGCD